MAKILIVDRRMHDLKKLYSERRTYSKKIEEDYLVSCYSNRPTIVASIEEAYQKIRKDTYDIIITHSKIKGSKSLAKMAVGKVIFLTDKYNINRARDLFYDGALSVVETPLNVYDFSLMLDRSGLRNNSRNLVFHTNPTEFALLKDQARSEKRDIYSADNLQLAFSILRTRKISEVIGLEDEVREAFKIYQTPLKTNKLIAIYGNSGSGKTTFENSMPYVSSRPVKVVSRVLRKGELQGIDTKFISFDKIKQLKSNDFFVFKKHDYEIGVDFKEISALLEEGSVVMSVPNPELLEELQSRYCSELFPIQITAENSELIERVNSRGGKNEEYLWRLFKKFENIGLKIENPTRENILLRELHFLEKHKIIRDLIF